MVVKGYVYTRMFSRLLEALATLKDRTEEYRALESLLGQRYWRRGKRARWYDRRALLLQQYICKYPPGHKPKKNVSVLQEALKGLKEALQDEDTGIGMH